MGILREARYLRGLLLAVALAVAMSSARADLQAANEALKKGDNETAFKLFEELAELGQPVAQFNLAVLYYNGQGVKESLTKAHAWASLARDNGIADAAAVVARVEPDLSPVSLKYSKEIQEQYSQAALERRLMPIVTDRPRSEDYSSPKPLQMVHPVYPVDARVRGVQGRVFAEATIAADGTARAPRILDAVPPGVYESAVRTSILRSKFTPAQSGGRPVSATFTIGYTFRFKGEGVQYEGLDRLVKNTLASAEAGDVKAQILYGTMLAGLPQLKSTPSRALPWFLKAAQAGAPYAQFQVGHRLMLGEGCECEETKGEIWLRKAAQADQPDAQLSLAQFLLRRKSEPDAARRAMTWLERASARGHDSSQFYLAALLATIRENDLRDPARALKLSDEIFGKFRDDPLMYEIRAAAYAGTGEFEKALRDERKAIEMATDLGWTLTPLQVRLSSYESGVPWTGDLFDF